MFTGIVDHCGEVLFVERSLQNYRLTVDTKFEGLTLGESVAIDGACLTVMTLDNNAPMFELSSETLNKTIAAAYKPGMQVNLELAMRLSDRLGGHIVTGHIDDVIQCIGIETQATFKKMIFSLNDTDQLRYMVEKGSVCINGVSLTINGVNIDELTFDVMIIPHTYTHTNLQHIEANSQVNIEFDYLAKLCDRQTLLRNNE